MKETRKQIKAQLVNELKRKFDQDTKNLVERNKRLSIENNKLYEELRTSRKEKNDLKEENEQLKEELAQHKEWIERLQDFCNLPEKERRSAFKTYLDSIQAEKDTNEVLSSLGKFYSGIFSKMM